MAYAGGQRLRAECVPERACCGPEEDNMRTWAGVTLLIAQERLVKPEEPAEALIC